MRNERLQFGVFLFNTWWSTGIAAFVVVESLVLLTRPFRRARARERAQHAVDPTPPDPDPEVPAERCDDLEASVDAGDVSELAVETAHSRDEAIDFGLAMETHGVVRASRQQGCQAPMRGRRGGWRRRGR